MEKKAEITSTQLITIIILIISFAVIIAFFFILDIGGSIDEESCRNSVSMRGAFSIFGKSPISLKCKTQDICLSMGNDCASGKKIEIRSELELYKELTNLIYNCWWMMGEGKIEYADRGCAICYNIYFDSELRKNYPNIKYIDIYNYMANKVPNKQESYLFTFYKLSSVDSVRNVIVSKHKLDILDDGAKIDTSKEYAVVDSYFRGYNPPIIVKFEGNELKDKFECKEYVTEA